MELQVATESFKQTVFSDNFKWSFAIRIQRASLSLSSRADRSCQFLCECHAGGWMPISHMCNNVSPGVERWDWSSISPFDGHEWGIFRKSIREVCSRSDSSCKRKSKPLTSRNPPLRLHAQLGDLIRIHHSLSRVERAVEIVKVFCKAIRQGTWHRSSWKAYSWKNS